MDNFKDAVRLKMVLNHIENYAELSKLTGIGYQTLRQHIRYPEQLRVYEIQALNEVLRFDDSEIVLALRG